MFNKKYKEQFDLGYKAGYEQGVIDGMSKNFERSKELTQQEYDEVIQFLTQRNVELCCYDVMRGGFRVRKSC